jgi:predicted transposase YdaD
MGEHDARYKFFFSHPRLVVELLRRFVPGEWVERLDLSRLERVHDGFVAGDLRQRQGDRVWRVRQRGGESPDLYLLLEFQSAPERFMALRLLNYVDLLLEELVRKRKTAPKRGLPVVVPIVLYRGERPWRAPLELRELFAPAPPGLESRLPRLPYLLIDEGRVGAEELSGPPNLAAFLFRIETSRSPEELTGLAAPLAALLPRDEEPDLRRAFTDFLVWALRWALPGVTMPNIGDLEEIAMIEHNMDRWREAVLRQGRQEGRKQGREEGQAVGMRRLLLRQMERRFGALPRWVRERVRAIASLPELERLAERVLEVATLEEMGLGEGPTPRPVSTT